MNLEHLQQKLLAAAKAAAPEERVPYAFEQRILARLAGKSAVDISALWARALWRAAVPCVVVTILLAALSLTLVSSDSATLASSENVAQQFEQALLGSTYQLEEIQ